VIISEHFDKTASIYCKWLLIDGALNFVQIFGPLCIFFRLLLCCLYRVSGNNRLRNDLSCVDWDVKLCLLTDLCIFTVSHLVLREAKVCRNLLEISWRFSTRLTSAVSPACAIATGYDPWRSTTQHGNTTPSAAGDAHMSTR